MEKSTTDEQEELDGLNEIVSVTEDVVERMDAKSIAEHLTLVKRVGIILITFTSILCFAATMQIVLSRVRDVLVTLPSPIIYLYRDHLFEVMWDEGDFKLFTLFDLCEEFLRQRELTSPTSVTLLDKCRTDVVRFCGHLSFSQIHAIMSRFPPLILDQLGNHFNKCN